MSERTSDFFRVKLLNAVIVAWVDQVVLDFVGEQAWYEEGKQVYNDLRIVVVLQNGYKVQYFKKGYKYRNITNREGSIKHFIDRVARTKPGAHQVDFYNAAAKPPSTPIRTDIL